MSEPEEEDFFKLCQSLEEEAVNSSLDQSDRNRTVVSATQKKETKAENPEKLEENGVESNSDANEDITLKLIDDFMLEETVDLRQKIFNEAVGLKASTPLRARLALENNTEELFKRLEKSKQFRVAESEENRPVESPPDQSLEVSKTESRTESILLAGNLLFDRDGKRLDLSLLDEEDDLEEGEIINETTVDQILQDFSLLDSEDEEEEEEEEEEDENEITVLEVIPAAPKVKPVEKPKPKKTKINKQDIANIDVKYYRELENVYDLYKHHNNIGEIPSMVQIRKPRVFYSADRNIVGFESLDEYIDNNHPLWCDLRDIFNEFLCAQKTDKDLAEFIHKQWNSGSVIDINLNLTSFPKTVQSEVTDRSSRGRHVMVPTETPKVSTNLQTPGGMKHKLEAMYRGALENQTVREIEDRRVEMYNSFVAESSDYGERTPTSAFWGQGNQAQSRYNCGICYEVCFCSPSRPQPGAKRKRDVYEDQDSWKRHCLSKNEYIDVILRSVTPAETEQRTALIIKSVEEAHTFNACYISEPSFDTVVVKELCSMEAAYSDFEKYYRSPYARDNPEEEEEVNGQQETKLSYTFIENY